MSPTFFTVVFLVTVNSLHTASCDVENGSRFSSNAVIYQIFEMFRSLIQHGDADKNIPITDPYVINAKDVQFNIGIIHGHLNITDGVLSGLGKFNVEEFQLFKDDLSMDIKVTIPLLKFEAECYELLGNIFEAVPLVGTGVMYMSFKHITLNTKLVLKQSDDGKSVLIGNLERTNFTIGHVVSLTEYDKNIDHILNAILDDYLADYLTRFSRYISDQYRHHILAAVNPVLNQYETWSIFSMIL